MSDDQAWNIMQYDKLGSAACCLRGRDVKTLMQDERLLYEVISRILHQISVEGLILYYPVSSNKMKYAFTNEKDLQNFISLILARRLKQWINDEDMQAS